jgi:DNA polymerase III subunit delta'
MESQPFTPIMTTAFAAIRIELARLAAQPPQVLLFEGGTEEERMALARYWAALQHCEQPAAGEPCFHCPACVCIADGVHVDVLAYDGRISNKEDEENPGAVRALSIDTMRQLKSRLRDSPHGKGKRVVLLAGMHNNRTEAANALLKVLEEPSATTIFVLLAPQREQLLPTLVSRSWVLTLPWPDTRSLAPALRVWQDSLAHFIQHGQGWFEKTSAKNAVTPLLAAEILLACQKALSQSLCSQSNSLCPPLVQLFAAKSVQQRSQAACLLDEANEALQSSVNPARVLDFVATSLFVLCSSRS